MHFRLTNKLAILIDKGSSFYNSGIKVAIVFPESTISSTIMTCLPFKFSFRPINVLT